MGFVMVEGLIASVLRLKASYIKPSFPFGKRCADQVPTKLSDARANYITSALINLLCLNSSLRDLLICLIGHMNKLLGLWVTPMLTISITC